MSRLTTGVRWYHLLPLVVFGVLIYSNTLDAPWVFDDLHNIESNANIRVSTLSSETLLKAAFGSICSNRPVANLSFAGNYYFHGYDVLGYHVVNIVVHLLTGVLLFLFVNITVRLSGLNVDQELVPWIAFFATALWLVNPIHTESVTYLVQRMTSMAAMFFMFSLLLYVKGRLARGTKKKWLCFTSCACAGLLALGTKEIAATLPFFILLYEWYFFQNLRADYLRRITPYAIGALLILGILCIAYLGPDPWNALLTGYTHRNFTMAQRVLTEFRVVVHYITLLLCPYPNRLNLDHDFSLSFSIFNPMSTLFCVLFVVGLVGWALGMARKHRLLSFCILWFFGNLVIESSIVPLEIIFEHRTYLPSMLFFMIFVVLAFRYVRRPLATGLVMGTVAVLFSLWTYQRNDLWRDPVTLWEDCVKKAGKKARPLYSLAFYLARQGRFDDAISRYEEALRIEPEHAGVHSNLGVALERRGRFEEAVEHYSEALRIDPGDAGAHVNMGAALVRRGELDKAVDHYNEALRIKPDLAQAQFNLGAVLDQQGRMAEAVQHYAEALRIDPGNAVWHYNLGVGLDRLGRSEQAIVHFTEAVRIEPYFARAYYNLGVALDRQGRFEEAVDQYVKALEIMPDMAEAHYNLGIAYHRHNQLKKAVRHYEKALELRPDFAKDPYGLEMVIRKLGLRGKDSGAVETP